MWRRRQPYAGGKSVLSRRHCGWAAGLLAAIGIASVGGSQGQRPVAAIAPPGYHRAAPVPSITPANRTPNSAAGLVPVVSRVGTTRPVVFLTMDDGVTRLPGTIAWFLRHRIPATAFLTDADISGDYGYFRRLQAAGVHIENHTVHHKLLRGKPFAAQRGELCTTSSRFMRAFGQRPTLFRPPFGAFDNATQRAVGICGMTKLVTWSVTISNGTVQYARGPGLRRGDIVLMHFTKRTLAELDLFLRTARRARLQPALLESYIG